MDVRQELSKLLGQIEEQIREVETTAAGMNIPAYKLRDANGNFVMAPLLAAKAQTWHSLVLMNQRR